MRIYINSNLLVTLIFLVLATTISLSISLFLTQGHFSYALDDPYIHMSTVKHFVEQGIWSVDGVAFASASSSPLWVIILSPFYLLFGAKVFVYIPFALNVLFQILSLGLLSIIVKKYSNNNLHYIFGITIILFTPFIALSFGGMEHSLQIFLIIWLISNFLSYINQPNSLKTKSSLLILAPFVVFVRYEDMALIVVMALIILFYFRNWRLFLGLLISSIIFVVIFGIWSKYVLNLGFIPSSILAKSIIGNEYDLLTLTKSIIRKFVSNFFQPHIITLYILNTFLLINAFIQKNKQILLLSTLFLLTLIIHLMFAKLGWLYRYEAYLIVFGLINIILYLYSTYGTRAKWAYVLLIFSLPIFGKQLMYSPYQSIRGSNNIYEQQIQMATFLTQHCDACRIAANDIGAITYFTNIHLLDLAGLGSYEVLEFKKSGSYTNEVKNSLLNNYKVSLVIIYDSRFKDMELSNYTKIGEWKILNNVVCGGDTVSFYSKNDKIKENYIKLKYYSNNSLPKDVVVSLMDSDI